jgi:crossover junction endodeoxyribonuclease RuvC
MSLKPSIRILGLDPGSVHTGFGLVEKSGRTLRVLDFGRISPPARKPLLQRVASLHDELASRLEEWSPQVVALEKVFRGPNVRSLIVLAQARGAILVALARTGVEVVEYAPAEVKSAVAGHGGADKTQVSRMVTILLGLDRSLKDDESDALALAICQAHRQRTHRVVAEMQGSAANKSLTH